MAQKIAAPAATLRRLARFNSLEADRLDDSGMKHNAQSCREAAAEAYDAAAGKSASLVSISAKHASTLAAFGGGTDDGAALGKMLRHQNYWD